MPSPITPSAASSPQRAQLTAPAPLPQALLDLANAPSTVPAQEIASARLIEQIEPADQTLCQLMSHLPSSGNATRTQQAQAVITQLEPLRQQLAQRAADGLRYWLDEGGRPGFAVVITRLQDRIQSAGLVRILSLLPLAALSTIQRRMIGEALRDAGAHTPTVRLHLALAEGELAGIAPIMLRDRLMSLEVLHQLTQRQRPGRRSESLRNMRALAYQHAAMVSRRFGYPVGHPAWDYLSGRRQDIPRTRYLCQLAGSPEARRHGINVQLP